MSQTITVSNITKGEASQYSVEFSTNFTITDLFYETSTDGTNWNNPIQITNLISPATISVPNWINFYVRLSSNYTPPPPYTRVHSRAFTTTFN